MIGALSKITSRTSRAVSLSVPERVAWMRSRKSSTWSSLYPRRPRGARSNVTQSTTTGVSGTFSCCCILASRSAGMEEVLRRFQTLGHQRLRRVGTPVDLQRQVLALHGGEVAEHKVR